MFKKIILTFVLLIFAQQEFYAMESPLEDKQKLKEKKQEEFWTKLDSYCNCNHAEADHPKLWLLWSILDNIPIQYGNSKIWKHGEAYYGLSNGIGFFHSFLNFGWMKIGIGDAHINVINLILVGLRYFVANIWCLPKTFSVWKNILHTLCYNIATGIHLLSFNFLNCVKIKIISIGMLIGYCAGLIKYDNDVKRWYHRCYEDIDQPISSYKDMSLVYLLLSPRIEINIPEIINYFKK